MNRVSAPRYDLFKLIVALILMAILILMLVRGCSTAAEPIPITAVTPSEPSVADAVVAADATDTSTPLAQAPTMPPTVTPTAAEPSPSPVVVSPEPIATTATPTTATAIQDITCTTSLPSQLTVGSTAQVVQRLNMRTEASIEAAILQTNPVRTQVEVIGGPVCTPVGASAYLWWQIRLADGTEGWSAETPLNQTIYLLEPLP